MWMDENGFVLWVLRWRVGGEEEEEEEEEGSFLSLKVGVNTQKQ